MDEPTEYISCRCGKTYQLTPANSYVISYWCQPWFAHVRSMCDCGEEQQRFFGPRLWEAQSELLTDLGIEFEVEEQFAPPLVVSAYTDIYRSILNLPTPRDLTDSDWRHIQFFHYLLEKGEMV